MNEKFINLTFLDNQNILHFSILKSKLGCKKFKPRKIKEIAQFFVMVRFFFNEAELKSSTPSEIEWDKIDAMNI